MPLRNVTTILAVHCSATKPGVEIGAKEIREWHMAKGWTDIGYHWVIRRSGLLEIGRNLREVGAHVTGFNVMSVGICLVGGLDENGNGIIDDFYHYTPKQRSTLYTLLLTLRLIYPGAQVCGHRDLSPDKNHDGQVSPDEWLKQCPGFDVRREFATLNKVDA